MRYCKIENGVITKYNQKRSSFGVGENSDEQTCIDKGYYILLGNPPSIDSATQRIGGSSYVIDEATKTVEKVYTVIDIPIEELQAKKIQEGETHIESLLNAEIVKFNTKYYTKFLLINDMASYAIDTAYSLQVQCDTLIKWKNNLWDTARDNQASVLDGTMTDAEFLAALPVAPIV